MKPADITIQTVKTNLVAVALMGAIMKKARKRQSRALKRKKHTQEHNKKISKGVKAYFCSYGEKESEVRE